jgi:hypothetical protein
MIDRILVMFQAPGLFQVKKHHLRGTKVKRNAQQTAHTHTLTGCFGAKKPISGIFRPFSVFSIMLF